MELLISQADASVVTSVLRSFIHVANHERVAAALAKTPTVMEDQDARWLLKTLQDLQKWASTFNDEENAALGRVVPMLFARLRTS